MPVSGNKLLTGGIIMTTWKEEIEICFDNDDNWNNVISCTLSEEELNTEFDDDYGGTEGIPFTLWTKKYVYFPICYDGSEWVARVSRNPDGKPSGHFGG